MDKNTPSYNLNVVVRETGIKPDTLRAWERRYGLPEPQRTEGGHRLYSAHDIEMIRWLMARQNEGMRISQAVQMWQDLQADGANPLNPSQSALPVKPLIQDLEEEAALTQLREAWLESCLAFNENGADQVFSQALARYPVQVACVEVLQKGLNSIGDKWYQSGITIQQEHFASAVAVKRLNALIAAAPAPSRAERILVGCPPGEEHIFSPLMASLFLRYHGYDVTYLGANVPLQNLEKTVSQVNPDLAVFTAMQLDTAASLLQTGNLLAQKGVHLAFGGRIFSIQPGLQKVIPGFFLGERLDQVTDFVSQALSGSLIPNPVFEPTPEYRTTLAAFDAIRMGLESSIYQQYTHAGFPLDYLAITNQHFNKFLRAALALGNLDYLSSEISWSETLVANNNIPAKMVADYLTVYRQKLIELGRDDLSLVSEWLADKAV